MSCASPRTPCSGPNSAVTLRSLRTRSRSIAWRSWASTEVALTRRPMRRPSSSELPSLASRASPVCTAIRSRLREDRHGLEGDLAVLHHDAEPDRAALVLRLELALVDLELGDEVLERDLVGVAGCLPRREIFGVDPLVIVGLRLLGERGEIRIRCRRPCAPFTLVELDAALDDRVALFVELFLARLGPAQEPRQHDVEAVGQTVELEADRAERAIYVAVDDVGDAELDLIDLGEQ